ncbi:mateRNAl protein pumilio [Anaeramoeba flamelloides]|uniref:MateRNAl protein pumilio n=1 Tax=Anaeramoeba flamelloides TaxID=1746091 RepID=A0AAV7YKH8_9EUKA|nr:mateRNAl protein pumilio [Anaeramoeba flamelloides]
MNDPNTEDNSNNTVSHQEFVQLFSNGMRFNHKTALKPKQVNNQQTPNFENKTQDLNKNLNNREFKVTESKTNHTTNKNQIRNNNLKKESKNKGTNNNNNKNNLKSESNNNHNKNKNKKGVLKKYIKKKNLRKKNPSSGSITNLPFQEVKEQNESLDHKRKKIHYDQNNKKLQKQNNDPNSTKSRTKKPQNNRINQKKTQNNQNNNNTNNNNNNNNNNSNDQNNNTSGVKLSAIYSRRNQNQNSFGGTKLPKLNPWISSDGDLLSQFRPRASTFLFDQINMGSFDNRDWTHRMSEPTTNQKKKYQQTLKQNKTVSNNSNNVNNNLGIVINNQNKNDNSKNNNNINFKQNFQRGWVNNNFLGGNPQFNTFSKMNMNKNIRMNERIQNPMQSGVNQNYYYRQQNQFYYPSNNNQKNFNYWQNVNSNNNNSVIINNGNSSMKDKRNLKVTSSYTNLNLNNQEKIRMGEYFGHSLPSRNLFIGNGQNQNKFMSQNKNNLNYTRNKPFQNFNNYKVSKNQDQDFLQKQNEVKNPNYINNYKNIPTLLDQFRENPEDFNSVPLSELYNELIPFCTDQLGSRLIRVKLEISSTNEKRSCWAIISPKAEYLLKNVFGNYIIQKFCEVGLPEHVKEIIDIIKGNVYRWSLDIYACRVVQKAFEVANYEDKASMVNEIYEKSISLVKDQNGNHVIQKCLECLTDELRSKIVLNLIDHIFQLSVHGFGCRTIQQLLKYYRGEYFISIVDKLLEDLPELILNQYGNYIVQNLLEFCDDEKKMPIFQIVNYRFLEFSTHKFASNVVEKCIIFGTLEEHKVIMNLLIANNGKTLKFLMNDRFGNYVIQRLIEKCNNFQTNPVLNYLLNYGDEWKKFSYGRHILKKINSMGYYN